ncbi:MAG TPA: DUF6412 domain-containing protein [Pseudonocardiaceae bacterium]|jgi:hypothetical protein|nr:DUF6412 domain-containing protein [Pseudonocardiaceae bacterium]
MTWTSVLSAFSAALSAFAIPGGILGLATVAAAAGLLLILLVCHVHGGFADLAATAGRIMAAGMRDRSRRTARLRLRDPNSAGRTRSRAPSPAQAAW